MSAYVQFRSSAYNKWHIKKILGFLVLIQLSSSVSGWAQSVKNSPTVKKPSSVNKNNDDKIDISDIEKKYWAPKDTDFSVVQNRTYTKEKRISVSLGFGPQVNETFTEGYSTGLAVNYFLSERYGLQLDYITSDYKNSNATEGFISRGGSPDYGRVTSYYGVGFNWIPFYAKMSVMGKKIIYFDMSITPTLGVTQYEALTDVGAIDKSSFTYGFEISQWFFLNNSFAVRLDFRQSWYKEDVVRYHGTNPSAGTKLRDHNQDNALILMGGTFFF